MRLSIEAKVAAAVGVAFGVLSICAMAQEQSERANSSTNSAPMSQVSTQDFNGSLPTIDAAIGENKVLGLY